ncbi:MAG: outer membrane protein [Xanthobacteraceae bacterium]
MKKQVLLGTALSLAVAGGAFAADLPPAPPPPPPVPYVKGPPPFSWTGCYLGAQAGYASGRSAFSDPIDNPPLFGATVNTQGGLVGGQAGCNYQFMGGWVAGLEAADAWASINGTSTDVFFGSKNEHAKTDQLGSLTGRLGFAADRLLIYGKGGVAWANSVYDVNSTLLASDFNGSSMRTGWTAGGGVEWALAAGWSAKIEYNHYDLGTAALNLVGSNGGGTLQANVKTTIETATVGLNFRFGH